MRTQDLIERDRKALKSRIYRTNPELGTYILLKLPLLIERRANERLDELQREISTLKYRAL